MCLFLFVVLVITVSFLNHKCVQSDPFFTGYVVNSQEIRGHSQPHVAMILKEKNYKYM